MVAPYGGAFTDARNPFIVEARGVEDTEKTIEAFCVNKLRIY
jgi:hypothetical protein